MAESEAADSAALAAELDAAEESESPMQDEPLGGSGSGSGAVGVSAVIAKYDKTSVPPAMGMPDAPPPPPPEPTTPGSPYLPLGGDAKRSCEVIDPQTHGQARSRFTDYCVLIPNVSAVRRRYSDFQWLHSRMHIERPGAIVPIIPHKRTVSLMKNEAKFSHEFVHERRANLEIFIRRILSHPELADAPSVVAFMKQDDELFASAKKANDFDTSLALKEGSNHSGGSDGTDDAVDTMTTEKDGLTNGSGHASNPSFPRIRRFFAKAAIASGAELTKTEDEEVFVDIDKYATELDIQILELAKHSASLSKTTKATSESMNSMALAFAGLSENTYPNTDLGAAGRLAAMLNNVAKGMLAMASVTDEKSQEETALFELKVQDFERDVQALKSALNRRKEKLYNLTTKLNKITKVGDKLDRMKDEARPGQEINIQTQEGALLEAREAADAARLELEDVSGRVQSEVERFRNVADEKLRTIVSELGGVQLRYNNKLNEGWGNLLTHVDAEQMAQGQVQVEPKVMSC